MEKGSDFFERLLQIVDLEGFRSLNDFALNGLGYKSSEKLNRLKDPGKNPSFEILLDISNKFEDINPAWLLLGESPMLRSNISNRSDHSSKDEKIMKLQDQVNQLQSRIIEMQDEQLAIKSNYQDPVRPDPSQLKKTPAK